MSLASIYLPDVTAGANCAGLWGLTPPNQPVVAATGEVCYKRRDSPPAFSTAAAGCAELRGPPDPPAGDR